ncbi:unnamed protein product [Ectocarpus sp. CCAP 1310/34]|nr:unnamed protein product [Ectocarpus sp. CCAP 1310/34]
MWGGGEKADNFDAKTPAGSCKDGFTTVCEVQPDRLCPLDDKPELKRHLKTVRAFICCSGFVSHPLIILLVHQ